MFKFFGEKGQSSSVFNLLIAALVSLAILGLLLTILSGVGVFGGNKPDETAADLLKSASNKAYIPYTKNATFSKTNNTISTLALAQDLSTGESNLSIVNCSSTSTFNPEGGQLIKYTGGSDKEVLLVAICGDNTFEASQVGLPEGCNGGSFSNPNGGNTDERFCYLVIDNKKG